MATKSQSSEISNPPSQWEIFHLLAGFISRADLIAQSLPIQLFHIKLSDIIYFLRYTTRSRRCTLHVNEWLIWMHYFIV